MLRSTISYTVPVYMRERVYHPPKYPWAESISRHYIGSNCKPEEEVQYFSPGVQHTFQKATKQQKCVSKLLLPKFICNIQNQWQYYVMYCIYCGISKSNPASVWQMAVVRVVVNPLTTSNVVICLQSATGRRNHVTLMWKTQRQHCHCLKYCNK